MAKLDWSGFVDCELLDTGLPFEPLGRTVRNPDLIIIFGFVFTHYLPESIPVGILVPVEIAVVPSMLHCYEASLFLGNVPYDLSCRGELELILILFEFVSSH